MQVSKARQLQLLHEPEHDKDKGYICEHCGMFVKRYIRNFNVGMAYCLLMLYKRGNTTYVHVEEFLRSINCPTSMRGDFAYLRHYRFIQKKPELRDDGSPRNGYYRITPMGIMYCERKFTTKSKFVMFNGKCEGFMGDDIYIDQALDTRFNYSQLMGIRHD